MTPKQLEALNTLTSPQALAGTMSLDDSAMAITYLLGQEYFKAGGRLAGFLHRPQVAPNAHAAEPMAVLGIGTVAAMLQVLQAELMATLEAQAELLTQAGEALLMVDKDVQDLHHRVDAARHLPRWRHLTMATSTELLRAAEHMRHQGEFMLEDERWHVGISYCEAADMLERESKRLQAIEAQQDGTCAVCHGVGVRPGIPSWNDCAACGGHGRVVKAIPKRAWPEGWPPFAVLRRAYSTTGMHYYPSTRVCERSRVRSHRAVAAETRSRWQRVLLQVLSEPSSP